jgi:hypothetical protein
MDFIQTYKTHIIIGIFVLVAFVIFSVSMYSLNHPDTSLDGDDTEALEEIAEQDEEQQKINDAEGSLSALLTAKRANYSEQETNFLGILCSTDWMINDQLPSVSFFETYYIETDESLNTNVVAFVITDIVVTDKSTSKAYSEEFTAAVETSTGTTAIIKLVASADSSGTDKQYSLTSSLFLEPDKTYTQATAQKEFNVEGMNTDILNCLDDAADTLQAQMRDFCAVYVPTSNTASWGETLYIDYKTGELTTYFELNDGKETDLTVVFDMVDKTFSIKK